MNLTEREVLILQLRADGENYISIADRTGTTPGTIRNRTRGIFDKLGADDMTHAVATALRKGIIK
jgi:DNA-binding NarL/FixJ family response regulator